LTEFTDIERRVGDYYSRKLAEHGATHAGVDWNSDASQHLRFAQLLKVAEGEDAFSLLDWGCGYGALLDVLGPEVDYVGYDVSVDMVQAARERYPHARFEADLDALGEVDYTVASGIFNVLAGSDAAGWEDYVHATARQMAARSRRGIAFNALTSYSDPERMVDRLHYADPTALFDWCKRTLSRNVALLHDYELYEFTILVRLDQGRLVP
jgi:cyclopropane fatty-acyl-phospholipid synthase-like methyltransferase